MQSLELDKLFSALCNAQHEFPVIATNRKAYTNTYADFYAIMKPVYPILHKHDLGVIPWAAKIDGVQMIGARLIHKSGQYIINSYEFIMDDIIPMKDKRTHKVAGALTYFKRYHVKDILGILLSDDPQDDDGQGEYIEPKQEQKTTINNKKLPEKTTMKKSPVAIEAVIEESIPVKSHVVEYITQEQESELERSLIGHKDIMDQILKGFKIVSSRNIPKAKFDSTMTRVDELKQIKRDSNL